MRLPTQAWSYALGLLGLASSVLGKEPLSSINYDELKMIPLRTHSLGAPYLDSYLQSRWFDFGGDAVVRTDSYIRLTGELPSRAGWIWSRVPLTATNWEVEIEFKIHGQSTLYGDGMAIWLTKQRAQQGPVFGFMDKFEGLGIFIDTYKNNRPGVVFPYVMAVMGDGNTPYDKDNDGKANELAGCPLHALRNNDHPTKMRITYIHDKAFEVRLQHSTEDDTKWDLCFSLPDVKIPAVAYLGFTAETGELSDNHDIISVTSRNIVVSDSARGTGPQSQGGKSSRGQKGDRSSSGGWGWFFIKFLLFGMVVAGGYVGFTAYRANQRGRSRF